MIVSNLITMKIKLTIKKDTDLPELHYNGQRGCDDDAERDEEADREKKEIVTKVISFTPGRGATKKCQVLKKSCHGILFKD